MELRDAPKIGVGRTAEVYAWGEGRVLKLFHDWVPEPWVLSELGGTAAAHDAGLPAPAMLGRELVEGRRGIVLQRIDGPSLMDILRKKPWRAIWAARMLAQVHAAIHARRVSTRTVPTMRERILWGIGGAGLPADVQRQAEARLERLPDGDALCHYDLHPENVLLTRDGPVVIDWMAAAVGHPLADVARSLLLMRIGGTPGPAEPRRRSFLRAVYVRRYLRLTGASRAALADWDLPIVAARGGEQIEAERPALLAWLERLAA